MTRHKRTRRAKLLRSLYIWHRYIGLTAALGVIILSVTGLLLNHTSELKLGSRHVQSAALIDWYGIKSPELETGYPAAGYTITQVGDRIYRDTRHLADKANRLIGAVELADMLIIGLDGHLLLYTPRGELIEDLGGSAGVPAGMQAIGITADRKLAIQAAHGYYQTDDSFLEWRETDTLTAQWSRAVPLEETLRVELTSAYRGSGLPVERVILDIHSGRILGTWGVYLVDFIAVLFIALALSGSWLWWRRRISAKTHSKDKHTRHSTD